MLNITLYNNKSSGEVLNKNLEIIDHRSISQYDIMSVENPQLILSGDDVDVVQQTNYVYIDDLKRYYNCVPVLLNDSNYALNCDVDPLMSFADEILNLNVIVDKNEYEVNPYIDDGSYMVEERQRVETIQFPLGFNDYGSHILITAGGA